MLVKNMEGKKDGLRIQRSRQMGAGAVTRVTGRYMKAQGKHRRYFLC